MSEEQGVFEVRLGIYATREQAEEVKERIVRMLCPDPGHPPPCPIPWSVMLSDGPELEEDGLYDDLLEQARIEQPGAGSGAGPRTG
ncbi:hypothetical protein GCM10012287_44140 [Streptomyces daqingensis]|uniref:SPOR domain-containing protein n=1 Tax=Streptomyces daqingensis TaxID=1472640 RepID=A0ABQ2MLC8_9ACTN|nr:hypothetical protein [Streptomyces daqingensis]GGO54665.1 hypothetical protein GCM10012287_44140 [Streptomyces daqingensis]